MYHIIFFKSSSGEVWGDDSNSHSDVWALWGGAADAHSGEGDRIESILIGWHFLFCSLRRVVWLVSVEEREPSLPSLLKLGVQAAVDCGEMKTHTQSPKCKGSKTCTHAPTDTATYTHTSTSMFARIQARRILCTRAHMKAQSVRILASCARTHIRSFSSLGSPDVCNFLMLTICPEPHRNPVIGRIRELQESHHVCSVLTLLWRTCSIFGKPHRNPVIGKARELSETCYEFFHR